MATIKVYLSARISRDAHLWNDTVCKHLKRPFEVFIPQIHNPWNISHEKFPKAVFEMDLNAMESSHIGLLLPEYGRDCAWEAGWYAKSDKPLVVFTSDQTRWLRDWMVKGGVDFVVTDNLNTLDILKQDPILDRRKVSYIRRIEDIHEEMLKIYEIHKGNHLGIARLEKVVKRGFAD
jgi:nucleoside 2-deoxyribosyltransferase